MWYIFYTEDHRLLFAIEPIILSAVKATQYLWKGGLIHAEYGWFKKILFSDGNPAFAGGRDILC
jgi:hypothetical protein